VPPYRIVGDSTSKLSLDIMNGPSKLETRSLGDLFDLRDRLQALIPLSRA
jgi:hypothetical protein